MNLLQNIKEYKDLKILYVENDITARRLLLDLLKKLFTKVITCKNAEDALELYYTYCTQTNNHYDIVITTINLPKMNGMQLCEEIKNYNKRQIIAITAEHTDSEYFLQAINIGIDKFITKPFSSPDDTQLELIELAKKAMLMLEFETKEFLLEQKNKIIDENVFMTVADIDGNVVDISQAYLNFTGYTREEVIGQNHSLFKNKEVQREYIQELWQTITNEKSWTGDLINTKHTGEDYWVHAVIQPLYDMHHQIIGYTSINKDITHQKRLEEFSTKDPLTSLYNRQYFENYLKREFKRSIWKQENFALLLINVNNYLEYKNDYNGLQANDVLLKISTFIKQELNPFNHEIFKISETEFAVVLLHERDNTIQKFAYKLVNMDLANNLRLSVGGINLDTHEYNLTCDDLYCIAEENLQKSQLSSSSNVILNTDKETIKSLKNLDRLTKLPNRTALIEDIELLDNESMLVILHINQFNAIKELYGHTLVQNIIKTKSIELQEIIQDEDVTLYNLNLQEFALIIRNKDHFDKYFLLIKHSILLPSDTTQDNANNCAIADFTAGIAYGTNNIFHHANVALQEAMLSKTKYKIYENKHSIKRVKAERLERLKVYKTALYNGDIIPYLQPIVNAQNHRIIKYEALARIKTDNGEIISPYFFLDSAQEYKTFEYFTRQMMQKVFNLYAKNHISVSINITYENIISESMMSYIKNRLNKYGGEGITFEILESEDIDDYTAVENFILSVKEYGCQIAIDDFGSGYSNFTNILRLNIDYIKLDGSLIKQLNKDENINKMVRGIVQYAKEANIQTIAEFVSTKELSDIVQEFGIDLIQGYYYGEPQDPLYYGLK